MLPHANINTKIPLLSLWMPRTLSDSERWLQCLNNCEWHFRFISLSLEQHHRTLPIENFSLYIDVIRLSKIVFFIFTSTIKTGILLYLRLTETWREREKQKGFSSSSSTSSSFVNRRFYLESRNSELYIYSLYNLQTDH